MTPTPTSTPTLTPSTSAIICGSGVTTGTYFYIDCCGVVQQGNSVGQLVTLDYTYVGTVGITKLNAVASVPCSTPTQTPTSSPTPTPSLTPSQTPSPTPTNFPSRTPSPTPTKTPVYILKNDCDVFTLFDLGVGCNVIQTPTSGNNNGVMSLKITGGTAPYKIYWNGVLGQQTMTNLAEGFYTITVIDYYGDYTANTICSLFVPTPTQTPTQTTTPSPTPTPQYSNICLVAIGNTSYGPLQFVVAGTRNGKPYWNSGNYNVVWKSTRWEVVGTDLTTPVNFAGGAIFASSTTSIPPLAGWQSVGGTEVYSVTMTQGTCPSTLPLRTVVTKTDSTCNTNVSCDGTITIATQFGVPPYQYSINNGLTWQSFNIFQGLCPNTYTILTRDSQLTTIPNTVVIGYVSAPQTYQLQINLIPNLNQDLSTINFSESTRYGQIVSNPILPVGTTIQGVITITKVRANNGPGSGTITDNISFTRNNIPISNTSQTSNTQIGTRPFCNPEQQATTTIVESYPFTMMVGDVLQIVTTSTLEITNGQISKQTNCTTELVETISASLSQTQIQGCNCCSVSTDQGLVVLNDNSVSYLTTT